MRKCVKNSKKEKKYTRRKCTYNVNGKNSAFFFFVHFINVEHVCLPHGTVFWLSSPKEPNLNVTIKLIVIQCAFLSLSLQWKASSSPQFYSDCLSQWLFCPISSGWLLLFFFFVILHCIHCCVCVLFRCLEWIYLNGIDYVYSVCYRRRRRRCLLSFETNTIF